MSYEYAPDVIDVAAWNVRDGFGDPERAPELRNELLRQNPDAAFIAEAYRSDRPGVVDDILDDFGRAGYVVYATDQEVVTDDNPQRPDAHGVLMIARRERADSIEAIQLAGRYGLRAMMHGSSGDPFEVIAHAASDVNEAARKADAEAFGELLDVDENGDFITPTVGLVVGGLLKRQGLTAHLLHAAAPIVGPLPAERPDPNNPPVGLGRFASVAQRLSDMASGEAYKLYESYGLTNADPAMRPTMRSSGVAVKFAHVLLSPGFGVLNHTVHPVFKPARSNAPSIPLNNREISARLRLS